MKRSRSSFVIVPSITVLSPRYLPFESPSVLGGPQKLRQILPVIFSITPKVSAVQPMYHLTMILGECDRFSQAGKIHEVIPHGPQ